MPSFEHVCDTETITWLKSLSKINRQKWKTYHRRNRGTGSLEFPFDKSRRGPIARNELDWQCQCFECRARSVRSC